MPSLSCDGTDEYYRQASLNLLRSSLAHLPWLRLFGGATAVGWRYRQKAALCRMRMGVRSIVPLPRERRAKPPLLRAPPSITTVSDQWKKKRNQSSYCCLHSHMIWVFWINGQHHQLNTPKTQPQTDLWSHHHLEHIDGNHLLPCKVHLYLHLSISDLTPCPCGLKIYWLKWIK